MSMDIPGRAHTPEQKRAIVERLYAQWLHMPDLRLGQLLALADAGQLLFYVEDEALLELIEMEVKDRTHEQ